MKKNYSLYGLPKKIEFCTQCTISNQRPRSVIEFKNKDNQKKGIQFNDKKICEACIYSKTKEEINWHDREQKLIRLLDKYRKNKGKYNESISISNIVLNLDPKNENAYCNLGNNYTDLGDFNNAEINFKKSLDVNKNNKQIFSNLLL